MQKKKKSAALLPQTFRVGAIVLGGGVGASLTGSPYGGIAGMAGGELLYRKGKKFFKRRK